MADHELRIILREEVYRKLCVISYRVGMIRDGMCFVEFVTDLLEREIEEYEKANGKIVLVDTLPTPR